MPSLHCFRSGHLIVLSALTLSLLLPCQTYAQAEAEGLSASFRKASRRVLPAVVTVRPDEWVSIGHLGALAADAKRRAKQQGAGTILVNAV